jgi:hypothetical protein
VGTCMKRASEILSDVKPTGEPYRPEAWMPIETAKKPSREFVKMAVRKLMGKPYAPSDDVAIGVVIDAIRQSCLSETHVERTVGKLIEDLPRWPDVTDIRQVALESRDVESRPNPGCTDCGGCGFRHERKMLKGLNGPEVFECAVRCDCWRFVKVTA